MKLLFYAGLFAGAFYGAMKLGTWLANRNRNDDPNNDEDQTDNHFV